MGNSKIISNAVNSMRKTYGKWPDDPIVAHKDNFLSINYARINGYITGSERKRLIRINDAMLKGLNEKEDVNAYLTEELR